PGIGGAVLPDGVAADRRPGMNAGVLATLAAVALLCLAAFLWRDALLRLLGYELTRVRTPPTAHEELRGTLAVLHRDGAFVRQERDRLGGLLDLVELEVSDVMVHRTAMRSV